MENDIKTVGRIADTRHIELDEPLTGVHGRVEITLRIESPPSPNRIDVFDLIASFPPGTRTKEEIARELDAARTAWDFRP